MKVTDPTSRVRIYAKGKGPEDKALLNGAFAHKCAITGLQIRAKQIEKEIISEEALEKPNMARLERLYEIKKCIESTLKRCH